MISIIIVKGPIQYLKVLVPIHSLIPPPICSKDNGDNGTKSSVIFRRLYVGSFMHKLCVVWEKSVDNPLKNEKTWLPPFCKTVNNINITFSNYFQYKFAMIVITLDDVLF